MLLVGLVLNVYGRSVLSRTFSGSYALLIVDFKSFKLFISRSPSFIDVDRFVYELLLSPFACILRKLPILNVFFGNGLLFVHC